MKRKKSSEAKRAKELEREKKFGQEHCSMQKHYYTMLLAQVM